MDLPGHVIQRLEAGWANPLPICEPCPPFNERCRGTRYRIERVWVVGVGPLGPDEPD